MMDIEIDYQGIADDLTEPERVALKIAKSNRFVNSAMVSTDLGILKIGGLLRPVPDYNPERDTLLTDYCLTRVGEQVVVILEARASAPVAGKPAAVTAKEFVEQRYAEKIAKGECVVKDEYLFCLIEPLSDCKPEVSGNYIFKTQARMNDTGWWESEINPSEKLSIVWLTPPQPSTPQPTLWGTFNPVTISAPAIDEWATKQPVSATVTPSLKQLAKEAHEEYLAGETEEGGFGDDESTPAMAVGSGQQSDGDNLRGRSAEQFDDMCGYLSDICEILGKHSLIGEQVVKAVFDLCNQLAVSETELSTLRDQNKQLRALCGRAADAIEDMVLCEADTALENELWEAAGGEG